MVVCWDEGFTREHRSGRILRTEAQRAGKQDFDPHTNICVSAEPTKDRKRLTNDVTQSAANQGVKMCDRISVGKKMCSYVHRMSQISVNMIPHLSVNQSICTFKTTKKLGFQLKWWLQKHSNGELNRTYRFNFNHAVIYIYAYGETPSNKNRWKEMFNYVPQIK